MAYDCRESEDSFGQSSHYVPGTNTTPTCLHCGMWHTGPCPRIKSIEYFPNGTVKRVEYHDFASSSDAKLPLIGPGRNAQ